MRKYLGSLSPVGLVVVAVVVAVAANFIWPASVLANEKKFDDGDLSGVYVGGVAGTVVMFSGDPVGTSHAVVALARIVADGEGELTFQLQRNFAGMGDSTPSPPVPCTYTIQPSGFGTITCPAISGIAP